MGPEDFLNFFILVLLCRSLLVVDLIKYFGVYCSNDARELRFYTVFYVVVNLIEDEGRDFVQGVPLKVMGS